MNALPLSPKPSPDAGLAGEVEVEIEHEAWLGALPDVAALVRQAARAALSDEALGADAVGEVVVLLTDDASLRDLNLRFRGRDSPTNVLAFPAAPPPSGGASSSERALGDVAVALGVCQAEARAQGKPLADHLRHLVAHGVLHLLGHDHQHEDEARVMEDLERRLLAGMGVPDPYAGDPVAKDTPDHVA